MIFLYFVFAFSLTLIHYIDYAEVRYLKFFQNGDNFLPHPSPSGVRCTTNHWSSLYFNDTSRYIRNKLSLWLGYLWQITTGTLSYGFTITAGPELCLYDLLRKRLRGETPDFRVTRFTPYLPLQSVVLQQRNVHVTLTEGMNERTQSPWLHTDR